MAFESPEGESAAGLKAPALAGVVTTTSLGGDTDTTGPAGEN